MGVTRILGNVGKLLSQFHFTPLSMPATLAPTTLCRHHPHPPLPRPELNVSRRRPLRIEPLLFIGDAGEKPVKEKRVEEVAPVAAWREVAQSKPEPTKFSCLIA